MNNAEKVLSKDNHNEGEKLMTVPTLYEKLTEVLGMLKDDEAKLQTLAAQILADFNPSTSAMRKKIEGHVSNIFLTIGIPAHIKGYRYLKEAVICAIETPEIIESITKALYPEVAKRLNSTSSKVERAIRHAIEVGWNRGRVQKINEIFRVDVVSAREKPTNGEFISLVAERVFMMINNE